MPKLATASTAKPAKMPFRFRNTQRNTVARPRCQPSARSRARTGVGTSTSTAGSRVKASTSASPTPMAVKIPNSRMGGMLLLISVPKPMAVVTEVSRVASPTSRKLTARAMVRERPRRRASM